MFSGVLEAGRKVHRYRDCSVAIAFPTPNNSQEITSARTLATTVGVTLEILGE